MSNRLRVNLAGDFFDRGGWGRVARGMAGALRSRVDLALVASNPAAREDHRPDGDVSLDFVRSPDPEGIGLAVGSVDYLPSVPGSPRVLSTVWETSRVPEHHLSVLRSADRVWVPTEWGRRLFLDQGLAPEMLAVVPSGVDPELFRPTDRPRRPEGDRFRFVCVGKWEVRKATDQLVRAFAEEFDPAEPVELVMHCHNIYRGAFDQRRAIDDELAAVGVPSANVVESPHGSLQGLIGLLRSADAFVLPTRAEAWGLPILEAMACGLPCIVTDYGGHRAFANEHNAYLIDVERQCPVDDPVHFHPGVDWGTWAQPDMGHLRRLMRHVVEHREEGVEVGRRAREDAVRLWSWENAGSVALRELESLAGRVR